MSIRVFRFPPFILIAILLLPGAAQTSRRGRQPSGRAPGGETSGDVLIRFEGKLTFASKKEIRIDVEGDQGLVFRVIKKTAFYRGKASIAAKDLVVDSHVAIEGRKELNGDLDAVNVWADEPSEEPDPPKDETKKQ